MAYKEAIFGSADHREVYKKQSGGRGKFADIIVKIGPFLIQRRRLGVHQLCEGR